jgi:hypothetical protein
VVGEGAGGRADDQQVLVALAVGATRCLAPTAHPGRATMRRARLGVDADAWRRRSMGGLSNIRPVLDSCGVRSWPTARPCVAATIAVMRSYICS